MRVLITGSRDWSWLDQGIIETTLSKWWREAGYPKDVTLVSGACPTGADRMAEVEAIKLGFALELHRADWQEYGKRAGFIRNSEMVKSGADICFAFIKDGSRGASHTADLAEKAGIPTIRIEK